jgi:hypothetical protein
MEASSEEVVTALTGTLTDQSTDVRRQSALLEEKDSEMDSLESQLFGEVETPTEQDQFEIDDAYQGMEGLSMVTQAFDREPYALALSMAVCRPDGMV